MSGARHQQQRQGNGAAGEGEGGSPRLMDSSSAAPAYYSASMSDMPQASPQSPPEKHQGFDPVDPVAAREALAAATGGSDHTGGGGGGGSDAGGSDDREDLGHTLPQTSGSPDYTRPSVDFGNPAVDRDDDSVPRPLRRTTTAVGGASGASSEDDVDGGKKKKQNNSGDLHVDPAVAAELGDDGFAADMLSPGPPASPGNDNVDDQEDASSAVEAAAAKGDDNDGLGGGGNGLVVTGSMAGLEAASTMYPSGTMVPTMSMVEPPPDARRGGDGGSPHDVSIPPTDGADAFADDATLSEATHAAAAATTAGGAMLSASAAASAPVTPQRELFPGAENALAFPPQALEALMTPAALVTSSAPGSPGITVTADDRSVLPAAAVGVPASLTPADLVASGHALLHLTEERRHVVLPAPAPRASGGCTVYTVVVIGGVCPTVVAVPSSTSFDTSGVAAAAVAEYGYRLQLARHMMQRVAVCLAHMRITVLHPVLDAATAHAHVLPISAAAAGGPSGCAALASSKRAPISAQSSPQAKAASSPSSVDLLATAEDWTVVLYGPPGVRASVAAVDHRPRGQCPCGLLECFPTSAVRSTTVGVVAAEPHARTVLARQSDEYRPFAAQD